MKNKFWLCAILITATQVGCAEKEEELNELEGTWRGSCHLSGKGSGNDLVQEDNGDEQSAPEYETLAVTFDGKDKVTADVQVFTDAACANQMVGLTLQGTYAIGADMVAPPGAKELNLTWTSRAISGASAEVIADFNEKGFCGAKDWVLNVARDVTTSQCGDMLPEVNKTEYELFKVENSSLYLSDKDKATKDGQTPETRLDVLTTTPLTK